MNKIAVLIPKRIIYISLSCILTSWIKTVLSFETKVSVVMATASVFAGFLVNPIPSPVVSVFRTYTACVSYVENKVDIDLPLTKLIQVHVKGEIILLSIFHHSLQFSLSKVIR